MDTLYAKYVFVYGSFAFYVLKVALSLQLWVESL